MRVKAYDLYMVLVITVIAVILGLAGVNNVALGVLFGAPLVLFLPGYGLTAALENRQLSPPERLLFSVGLSLALTVLAGLVLSWTPWGLQRGSWAVLLGGMRLAATLVALIFHH